MKNGFTLVELIIVVVILGLLSVIAIPKLVNTTASANQSAVNAVAHTLNIVSQHNYSLSRTGSTAAVSIGNCTAIANLLPAAHPLPTGYVITSQSIPAGNSVTCTVTHSDGSTIATFRGMGVA